MVKKNRFVAVRYECGVCGTTYRKKEAAKKCERRPTEDQTFWIGDRVRAFEPRECSMCGQYRVENGEVINATLVLADEEYKLKWIRGGAKRLGSHVLHYEVEFRCKCPETKTVMYYSPEITKVKKRGR